MIIDYFCSVRVGLLYTFVAISSHLFEKRLVGRTSQKWPILCRVEC